jgi:hypothetical protein
VKYVDGMEAFDMYKMVRKRNTQKYEKILPEAQFLATQALKAGKDLAFAAIHVTT